MPNVPPGGAALVIVGAKSGATLTVPDAAPVPMAFVAFAEHEYVVPAVIPVTVIGEAAPEAVSGPGVHETV